MKSRQEMNAEVELHALADAIAKWDAYSSQAREDGSKRESSPPDAGEFYMFLGAVVHAVESLLRVGLNPGESFLRFFQAAAKQIPPTPEIHPLVCAMFDTQDVTLLHMPIVERERLYLVMSLGLPGSLMRTAQRCFRLTSVVSQFYHVESPFCHEKFLEGSLQPMLKRLARLRVKAAGDVEEGIRLLRRLDLAEEARAERASSEAAASPICSGPVVPHVAPAPEEPRPAVGQSASPTATAQDLLSPDPRASQSSAAAHVSGPQPSSCSGHSESMNLVAAKSTAIVIKKKRRSKPLPQDLPQPTVESIASSSGENAVEVSSALSPTLPLGSTAALTDAATQTAPLVDRSTRASAFTQTVMTDRRDADTRATAATAASLAAWDEQLRVKEAALARFEASLKEKEAFLAKKEQLVFCLAPAAVLNKSEQDARRFGGSGTGDDSLAAAAATPASPQPARLRSLSMAIRASLEREGGQGSRASAGVVVPLRMDDGCGGEDGGVSSPAVRAVTSHGIVLSSVQTPGATSGNGERSPGALLSGPATPFSVRNDVRDGGGERSTASVDLAAGGDEGAFLASEELVIRAQLAAEAQGWVCYSCSMPLEVRRPCAGVTVASEQPGPRFPSGVAHTAAERLSRLPLPRSSKGSVSQRADEASESGYHLSASNSDVSSATGAALRWCHVSNAVYCESCLPPNSRWYVAKYVCRDWNFAMYPVCSSVLKMQMQSFATPSIVPEDFSEAVSQIPVLVAVRGLRQQLRILASTVRNCEQRGSMLDEVVNSRYCALDESYTLADLVMLSPARSSCPVTAVASVSLLDRLKDMRDSLVIHCARTCHRCRARSSKSCSLCSERKPLFLFDTQHTSMCDHCGAVYHRECWSATGGSCAKCKGPRREGE